MISTQLQSGGVRATCVAVVDPRPADYAALLDSAAGEGLRVELLARGHEALRLARTGAVDLWVINTALPDMSGLDLCAMLKAQLSQPVIYVVTDDYCAEEERAARARRASFFGCKPVQAWWFNTWSRPPP